MSTSPIGSSQSSLYVAWQSTVKISTASDGSASTSSSGQGDTVTISQQGFALLQTQGGAASARHHHHHHRQLTDDQAAKVGAKLQQSNPDVFKQLDQDGDGKLTADELKKGLKQLREQAQQQGATGSTVDTSALDAVHQAIQDVVGSDQPHRHHPHLTDDQASKIGAKIQEKDSDLFKQLDQDGDGTLTADELKKGLEQLRQQDGQQGGASDATRSIIHQAFADVLGGTGAQG